MSVNRVASAYDERASEYTEKLGSVDQMTSADRDAIESWRRGIAGVVLDAGCGPGHWTAHMAGTALGDVLGLDGSAAMLASARRRFPDSRFVLGDIGALPFADASVEGILAWFSLIHIDPDDLAAVLAELARVSVPGGRLLIGYVDGSPGVAFDHAVVTAYYWSRDALAGMLHAAGWAITGSSTRHDVGSRPQGHLTAQRLS